MGILEEAKELVYGDRMKDYDPPDINFERIAKIWSVILGQEISLRQVALLMIGLKLARELGTSKRDNWVDMAGYVACVGYMVDNEINIDKKGET